MRNLIFFSLLIISILVNGQDSISWNLKKTVKVPYVSSVSADPYGNVFFADSKGNVYKYNNEGAQLLTYSPARKGDVHLLEAWRNVNVFIFYRQLQEFTILDRFLNTSNPNLRFTEESDIKKEIGFVRTATLSGDNKVWLFDDEDFSLKKYNPQFHSVEIRSPLELLLDPANYDLTFIREYQNLVFINDRNSGILVFDNLGNYKQKLPIAGLEEFGFLNNNLYYFKDNKLVEYNLYSAQELSYPLPTTEPAQKIILTERTLYIFCKDKLFIFEKIKRK